MGHTVGKDKNEAGKFAFELYAHAEKLEARGGFATHAEAQAAAQLAERRLCAVQYDANAYRKLYVERSEEPTPTLEQILAELTDDDLLAELTY
jgi:hypothetical protein